MNALINPVLIYCNFLDFHTNEVLEYLHHLVMPCIIYFLRKAEDDEYE